MGPLPFRIGLPAENVPVITGNRPLEPGAFTGLALAELLFVFLGLRQRSNQLTDSRSPAGQLLYPGLRAGVRLALENVTVQLRHHSIGVCGARLLSRRDRSEECERDERAHDYTHHGIPPAERIHYRIDAVLP
jgi:hypothetical protein